MVDELIAEAQPEKKDNVKPLPVKPQQPEKDPEPDTAARAGLKGAVRVNLENALAIHDPVVLDNLVEEFKLMGNNHAQAWAVVHHLLRQGFHIRQHG